MPTLTALSVTQLKQEAKVSIERTVAPNISPSSILTLAERTFQDAQRCDESQLLHDAFFKYQQGARYIDTSTRLPGLSLSFS